MIGLHLYSTSNSHQTHIKVKSEQCIHMRDASEMKNSAIPTADDGYPVISVFSSFVKNGTYRSVPSPFTASSSACCVFVSSLHRTTICRSFCLPLRTNSNSAPNSPTAPFIFIIFTKRNVFEFHFCSFLSCKFCSATCPVLILMMRWCFVLDESVETHRNRTHNEINNVTSTVDTANSSERHLFSVFPIVVCSRIWSGAFVVSSDDFFSSFDDCSQRRQPSHNIVNETVSAFSQKNLLLLIRMYFSFYFS